MNNKSDRPGRHTGLWSNVGQPGEHLDEETRLGLKQILTSHLFDRLGHIERMHLHQLSGYESGGVAWEA